MKMYKILVKRSDGKYYSPFKNYCYGKLEDFLGKEMTCDNFDSGSDECSRGYYATEIEGLIYTNFSRDGSVVFEVEMSGENRKFGTYKHRFENQKFIGEIPLNEVKELVKEQSERMDWNYYEALFPTNPLKIKAKPVSHEDILLLKEWSSVRDSVWRSVCGSVGGSVRHSVWYSVRDSVWRSVRDSVEDSVGDSVWRSVGGSVWRSVGDSVSVSVWDSVWDSVEDLIYAHISSLFPNIKDWQYIDHKEGINPFQSGIDLWNKGLVPSFNGNIWRLHAGEKADVVFEIGEDELKIYN